MSGRDANQLARDVRDALPERGAIALAGTAAAASRLASRNDTAHSALDELVGLVGTLQQERDEAGGKYLYAIEEKVAAEAALAEMTARRDEAEALYRATAEHLRHAQAEVATTRQALTQIEDSRRPDSPAQLRAIARRALADTGGDTP